MYTRFTLGILLSSTNSGADWLKGQLCIVATMNVQGGDVIRFIPVNNTGKAWTTSLVQDITRHTGEVRVYTLNSRYIYREAECKDLPTYF